MIFTKMSFLKVNELDVIPKSLSIGSVESDSSDIVVVGGEGRGEDRRTRRGGGKRVSFLRDQLHHVHDEYFIIIGWIIKNGGLNICPCVVEIYKIQKLFVHEFCICTYKELLTKIRIDFIYKMCAWPHLKDLKTGAKKVRSEKSCFDILRPEDKPPCIFRGGGELREGSYVCKDQQKQKSDIYL